MNQLFPWTFDAETFYTDKANGQYSLKWMTAEEYIRDPRFDLIGFSLKPGDQPSRWFTGTLEYLRQVARQFDWSKIQVIGHNSAEFDNLILTEVLQVKPAAYTDTLQMARALGNGKDSYSLDALAKRYGLPNKGHQVANYINKRRLDFTPQELADYGLYCGNSHATGVWGDADICWALYKIFAGQMPVSEYRMMNLCARMYAEPKLMLDAQLLDLLADDMMIRKQALLDRVATILNVNPNLPVAQRMAEAQTLLRKDTILADVLTNQYGVAPPMKYSKKQRNPDGTPKLVYAFAKTDEGMEELLEYEDASDPAGAEDVQALAAGRLGVKSTLAETRVNRFRGIARRGMLPVPLGFGRTHTNRLAGTQKINMQNLGGTKFVNEKTLVGTLVRTPRGIERLRAYNPPTKQIMVADGTIIDIEDGNREVQCWIAGLRDCIVAPPGKKIVVVDSSQIELRVCHLLAGQLDTVEDLRRGADVYSNFASSIYHRPITKADKKERQHGKVGMLQLQYQAGGKSFRNAARVMGGVRLSEDQAFGTVTVYRERFTEVRKFWQTCQRGIENMVKGGGRYLDQWGLCKLEHNAIHLAAGPARIPLSYHNLRQEMVSFDGEEPTLQWVYDDKEKRYAKRIYGGSVTENLCQWLAGYVVKDQTLDLEDRWGNYWTGGSGVALMVHDEAVLVVDEDKADACLADSLAVFSTPPAWWPQLPVAAEGGIGQRYAEAK
jgi:hypothetical protein